MENRKLVRSFSRKLTQAGKYSLSVTLPVEYLEELGWEKGERISITVRKRREQLVLEKAQ